MKRTLEEKQPQTEQKKPVTRMGRPPRVFPPDTEEKVRGLASIHCTIEEMADVLDIPASTLQHHFQATIKKAWSVGKASLRRVQWQAAQAGNMTAMIWLGKQLLGQSDYRREELSGPGGSPLQMLRVIIEPVKKAPGVKS